MQLFKAAGVDVRVRTCFPPTRGRRLLLIPPVRHQSLPCHLSDALPAQEHCLPTVLVLSSSAPTGPRIHHLSRYAGRKDGGEELILLPREDSRTCLEVWCNVASCSFRALSCCGVCVLPGDRGSPLKKLDPHFAAAGGACWRALSRMQ